MIKQKYSLREWFKIVAGFLTISSVSVFTFVSLINIVKTGIPIVQHVIEVEYRD